VFWYDLREEPRVKTKHRGVFMRRWRKMTWVLIGWCTIILIWAIAGGASNNSQSYCESHPSQYLSQHACEQARNVGTGLGVALILVIGFVGFVFFSIIWLMTKPRRRQCPACGEDVKKGRTTCPNCGHDFAAAVAAQPQGASS
jgi:H+/Cl- antiporter ClcA